MLEGQMNTEFDYVTWYNFEATKEDRALVDRVYAFEEYFKDMMFAPGTPVGELIKVNAKSPDADEWSEEDMDLPDELVSAPYNRFKFIVAQPDFDCGGYFDEQARELCVTPDNQNDDASILHEMIHLHEFVVNQQFMFYHDTLLWSLYSDLKSKIPELDTIINEHAHILNESTLYASGGLHDILFLLKSFDLDIKKGYPLGTVFAYGRADDFKDYTYTT